MEGDENKEKEVVVEGQNADNQQAAPVIPTDPIEKGTEIEVPVIATPTRNVRKVEEQPKGDNPAEVEQKKDEPKPVEYWKSFEAETEDDFKGKWQKLNEKSQFIDETPEDVLAAMIMAKKGNKPFNEAYEEIRSLEKQIEIPEEESFLYTDEAKSIYIQGEKLKKGANFDEEKANERFEKLQTTNPELLQQNLESYAEKLNKQNEKRKSEIYKEIEGVSDKAQYKEAVAKQQEIVENNRKLSKPVLKSIETYLSSDEREYVKLPIAERDQDGKEQFEDISYYSRTKEDNKQILDYADKLFESAVSAIGARPIGKDISKVQEWCLSEAKKAWEIDNLDKIKAEIYQTAMLHKTKQEFANLGAGAGDKAQNNQQPAVKVEPQKKGGYVDAVTGLTIL